MKTTICILTLILPAASILLAAPGDLDTTFGTGGKVVTPIGTSSNDFGYSMAVQTDGKILVAGSSYNGSDWNFALVRYNVDGGLDTGFGSSGKVITDFNGGASDMGFSVAVQNDGKILVAGTTISGMTLVRYNTNGSLDTSFSGDGKAATSFNNSIWCRGVVVQSDGKIVVVGFINDGTYRVVMVRYNSDGSLDTNFGTGGKVTNCSTGITTMNQAHGIALLPDGRIALAGTCTRNADLDFAVAIFETDGSLRSIVPTNILGWDTANSVLVQPDGKVLVAGSSNASSKFAVVRYNQDFSLDTSFGDFNGIATFDIGTHNDEARSMVLQIDGKIVIAGYSDNGSNTDFAVARCNTDGTSDLTFGNNGRVVTPIGSSNDEAWGVAVQSDGNIVVAGYTYNGNNNDLAVVRYNGGAPPPEIMVEQPPGTNLVDGAASVAFGSVTAGGNISQVFTLKNSGGSSLAGVNVTINGDAAADFALTTAPPATVNAGGSATFTIRFAPVTAGTKIAALHIASNDSEENPFDITLTGQSLDPNADEDGDGLTNGAEVNLAALGFDPLVNNAPLVALLRNNGLYLASDMQTLALGCPQLEKNPTTGHFHLSVGIEKTSDLKTWSPLTGFTPTFDAAKGKVSIEITPDGTNASFYRVLGTKP